MISGDEGVVFGLTGERFRDVRRIVVLRGGGLGDLLFTMPALEAIRAAYPGAEITLLGTPLHADLLAGRPSPVDRVEVLPIARGVRDPPIRPAGTAPSGDPRVGGDSTVASFRRRIRASGPIDLAVQLHGGGRHANPFLLALEPRHSVGPATVDAARLERTLPYVLFQHEVLRWLEVAALAGAPAVEIEPHLAVTAAEISAVVGLLPDGPGPVVVVHPGANDTRRRWPAARFAAVVSALVGDGVAVRIVGGPEDRALAEEIRGRAGGTAHGGPASIRVLAGELPLGASAALLAAADVVVANDSGPRHLAQAVGTATVGIFWLGNVITAAPLTRLRHRVHLSFITRCPVCGIDVTQVGWTAPRCPHDVSLVAEVDPDAVLADVRQLLPADRRRGLPGPER